VIGASVLGLDYLLTTKPASTSQIASTSTSTSKFNLPPLASFGFTPKYLNPTDRQTIRFTNLSTDLNGDPLTYKWLVDNQLASIDKDYSTILPVGQHSVELEASDSASKATTEQTIVVEPDQIFPANSLNVRYKGMRYSAGAWAPYAKTLTPNSDRMDEELSTIMKELGCNAILAMAGEGYEDNLIECGKLAIQKGFERVYIQQEYMDSTIDETIQKVHNFAEKMKPLSEMSDSVVLVVGHEFGLETSGIIPGSTWYDRLQYQTEHNDWLGKVRSALPAMLSAILADCKQNYGHPITYSAAIWEDDLVPWQDPSIESVCVDAYIMDSVGWTADWISRHLSSLKKIGKPVNSAEWGCMTFTGAGAISGTSPLYVQQHPYDEEEQANYIQHYCEMLNQARISGSFYTLYADWANYPKGFGILHGDSSQREPAKYRKKGFYAYKSYQRMS
jgi:Glycoside Hydrolase Family 113